jgi:exopolysaccharide/PEP-CTERM locus tyrosine autokinase
MSLIESALAKLRRAEEADSRNGMPVPRPVGAPANKGSAALVAPVPPPTAVPVPEVHEPAKRITIDMRSLREAGYLPEEGLERRFADHYRQIKRPLIEKAFSGTPEMRLIMVCSALPGDGKTFTSINLAFSMARERDATVLLIDADAPRAHISQVLGIRGEPGLLDALADHSIDVESLVLGTDVRGLEILPAGKFVENATELLASGRMAQITTRLVARDPRRLVVFDSAPLLVSSEARALARAPGQVVVVARAAVTPLRALTDAIAQVDKNKLQGVILNHTGEAQGAGYYYGYSDYGAETSQGSGGD